MIRFLITFWITFGREPAAGADPPELSESESETWKNLRLGPSVQVNTPCYPCGVGADPKASPLPPAPSQKVRKKWSKIESEKNSQIWLKIVSQRDPQNLKNLTKSAKWEPQMPFESAFARFQFRKGFQVVSRHLQNLKNVSFTIVKPLFSEIHSTHKIVSFGPLLGAFWHHFRSLASLMAPKVAKRALSKSNKKSIKF